VGFIGFIQFKMNFNKFRFLLNIITGETRPCDRGVFFKEAVVILWESVLGAAGRTGPPES